MQVREKNLLERRKVEAGSSEAFENATACIDENPGPLVDGHEISGGGPMWVRNWASTTENGNRQSRFQELEPPASRPTVSICSSDAIGAHL
jgi:hypothetical protein